MFPAVNTLTNLQLSQFKEPNTITVNGSTRLAVRNAVLWMRSSCDGKGLKPYTETQPNPFIAAHHDHIAATQLQIPNLITRIESYMQSRLYPKKAGLSDAEVAELYNINAYFQYRPPTGEIPAHEISALLNILQKQPTDTIFSVLIHYVADATWADMKLQYAQNENENSGVSQAGNNRGGTKDSRVRYASRQYVGVRNMYEGFGEAVNVEIEEYKKAYKAEKARVRAEARGASKSKA